MRVYHDFFLVPRSRSTFSDADPDPAKWYGSETLQFILSYNNKGERVTNTVCLYAFVYIVYILSLLIIQLRTTQSKFKEKGIKSFSSYEILSHCEVCFRGFIKYIRLIYIADLNPLKSTFIRGERIDILIIHRPSLNKINFSLGLPLITIKKIKHKFKSFNNGWIMEL